MLNWFHTKQKTLTRGALALAGLLWLIAAGAPCVMAQMSDADPASTHCPDHAKHGGPAAMPDCGPATVINCQLPETGTPSASGIGDLAATPVLLTTLPLTLVLADTVEPARHRLFVPDIPAPPLHIQHLTLIL